MTILLKEIYRYNAIPIKLSMAFFTKPEQNQKTPNSQSNIRKKNGAGEIRLPDFTLYYKKLQ